MRSYPREEQPKCHQSRHKNRRALQSRLIKSVLVLTILAQTAHTQCTGNCAQCTFSTCALCYKQVLSVNTAKCLPSAKPLKGCLFYDFGEPTDPSCSWCDEEHSVLFSNVNNPCLPLKKKITNCVKYGTIQGVEKCLVCGNGTVPTDNGAACVTPSTPLEHCLWAVNGAWSSESPIHKILSSLDPNFKLKKGEEGDVAEQAGQNNVCCIRCKAGFLAFGKNYYFSCIPASTRHAVQGCILQSPTQDCRLCDVWNGWFSLGGDGGCQRQGGRFLKKD